MILDFCITLLDQYIVYMHTYTIYLWVTFKLRDIYYIYVLHTYSINVLHSLNNINIHDPPTEEIRMKIFQLWNFEKSVKVKGYSGKQKGKE